MSVQADLFSYVGCVYDVIGWLMLFILICWLSLCCHWLAYALYSHMLAEFMLSFAGLCPFILICWLIFVFLLQQTSAYLRLLRYRYTLEPCPFHNTRIAFVDQWFTALWAMHYNMFKMNPKLFDFDKGGYKKLFDGEMPMDQPTNMKWFYDVDHLYMIIQVNGDHWVCLHVDLLREKIDCYDSIIGEGTKESDDKIHDYCRPYCSMIPAMLNRFVPAEQRGRTFKPFGFRRRKRNIPQNDQVGDCGVYAVKFAECLALGVTFEGINDQNIQAIRLKMAAEILDEAPDILAQFN